MEVPIAPAATWPRGHDGREDTAFRAIAGWCGARAASARTGAVDGPEQSCEAHQMITPPLSCHRRRSRIFASPRTPLLRTRGSLTSKSLRSVSDPRSELRTDIQKDGLRSVQFHKLRPSLAARAPELSVPPLRCGLIVSEIGSTANKPTERMVVHASQFNGLPIVSFAERVGVRALRPSLWAR